MSAHAEYEEMLLTLSQCSCENLYKDFERFRSFAVANPTQAREMVWKKVVSCPDLDEGELLTGLFQLLQVQEAEIIEQRIFTSWVSLPEETRLSIISTAGATLSLPFWQKVFTHPSSGTQARHRLFANLWRGRHRHEFAAMACDFVRKIGRYHDGERDPGLQELVDIVDRQYAKAR